MSSKIIQCITIDPDDDDDIVIIGEKPGDDIIYLSDFSPLKKKIRQDITITKSRILSEKTYITNNLRSSSKNLSHLPIAKKTDQNYLKEKKILIEKNNFNETKIQQRQSFKQTQTIINPPKKNRKQLNEFINDLFLNKNFYYLIKKLELDETNSLNDLSELLMEKIECLLNTNTSCFLNLPLNMINIPNCIDKSLNFYSLLDIFEKYYNLSSNETICRLNLIIFLKKFFQSIHKVHIPLIYEYDSIKSKSTLNKFNLDQAQLYWIKFYEFFNRHLSFCDTKIQNLYIFKLNTTYLMILYDFYKLFTIYIFKYKNKTTNTNWLRFVDYFKVSDEFFYKLIDWFKSLILKNYKREKIIISSDFKSTCQIIQYLILHHLIFIESNQINRKLNQFLSTIEDIFRNCDNNYIKQIILEDLILETEIKMKICETLLLKDKNLNESDQLNKQINIHQSFIFKNFINQLLNVKDEKNFEAYVNIVNVYLNLFINKSSNIDQNSLLLSLYETDDASKISRLFISLFNEFKASIDKYKSYIDKYQFCVQLYEIILIVDLKSA